MDELRGWSDAPAVIVSCPGPLRRQESALLTIAEMALPQVLLGSESQLLAFAAATTGLAGRLFFAPMPEMFPGVAGLHAAWQPLVTQAASRIGPRAVHLRFGAIRSARVLKGIRNAAVIAEAGSAPPLTASHHPFASGAVLPAAMRRLFAYRADAARPAAIGGGTLPVSLLPDRMVTADLATVRVPSPATDPVAQAAALDLSTLLGFRSGPWASGRVGTRGSRALAADQTAPPSCVLLPWNMDHPGSIVPDLLERLVRLHAPTTAGPRIILLPFNYIGQTGIIRRLITRLREASHDPDAALAEHFIARVTGYEGIPALRRLSATAWVDGNDPEHWWTLARLSACGIGHIVIDPAPTAPPAEQPGCVRFAADETIWVQGETRCGALTFSASLPSLRALPRLLALTEAQRAPARITASQPTGRARPRAAQSG